jgi:phenylpropionate dioxygenase-like ring-hydroxylating dioxygenase large terminal subunit
MLPKTLLGEPLLLGRDAAGGVFALRDICPHRGMPLSYGDFDGSEIECCYHGWRFGTDGRCKAISSLSEAQPLDLARIRVKPYPALEVQGHVWVFFGSDPAAAPEPPRVPDIGDESYALVETMQFDCTMDDAVVGLVDPAHGPFVHRSWWWRTRRSIHEKEKSFVPSPLGFTMTRHKASKNSKVYRLLGGVPESEIAFRLPGVRIEHIRAGRHVVCNLTAVTPIDERHTEVTNALYWTVPWLDALKPLLRPFARSFLGQDRAIFAKQREGLRHHPTLMLVGDADMQAKWYYRLKNEHARACAEGRPFVNPVKPRTLRWRS